jgi:predicted transcriptional regulator
LEPPLPGDRLTVYREHPSWHWSGKETLVATRKRGPGELEAAVMDVVWAGHAPVTVKEVMAAVASADPAHPPAYTTVMTVLERLLDKGALTRQESGRAHRYRAARTREEHIAAMMGDVLDGSADRTTALHLFAARLPLDEVEELLTALRREPPGAQPQRR